MSFGPAHQSTLVELARVEREREDLRRYASRLREQCSLALGYLQALAKNPHRSNADILAAGLRAALAGEIEPQDPEVLASGSPVKRTSDSVSIHIYQDRVNGEGFVLSGFDVEHVTGQPVVELTWEVTLEHEITFAQTEQLRDALTMILAREPAKQDPVADAAEDEAFRVAVARMDAAEAREDAAERKR